jgi:hypothetical protein
MKRECRFAQFLVEDGPEALFRRVRFIMGKKPHARIATVIPGARKPLEKIINLREWQVVAATVRVDRGKFVTSTWEGALNGEDWRVEIGMNETVLSIGRISCLGRLSRDLNAASFYRFVADVNNDLMTQDLRERRAPDPPIKRSIAHNDYQRRILKKVQRANVRSDKVIVSKATLQKAVAPQNDVSLPPSGSKRLFRYSAGLPSAQNDKSADFPRARWT